MITHCPLIVGVSRQRSRYCSAGTGRDRIHTLGDNIDCGFPKGRMSPRYSPCLPHLEGDALNCGDLDTTLKPVTVRVVGVDPYRLDRDGDGCTS